MSSTTLSELEQLQLLHKLNVFRIHGRDKRGRKILTILAKFFPGMIIIYIFNLFLSIYYCS